MTLEGFFANSLAQPICAKARIGIAAALTAGIGIAKNVKLS